MGMLDKIKSLFTKSKPEAKAPEGSVEEGLEAKIDRIEARQAKGLPLLTREELAAKQAAEAEFDARQVEALRDQIASINVRQISAEEGEAIGEQILAQLKGEVITPKPGRGNVQGISAEALQNDLMKVRIRGGREAGVAQGAAETAAIEAANRAVQDPVSFEGTSTAVSTVSGIEDAPHAEDFRDVAEPGGMVRLEDLRNAKQPGSQDNANP